jgi:hypothetical protein
MGFFGIFQWLAAEVPYALVENLPIEIISTIKSAKTPY